jgi:hypothetical protein
MLIRRRSFLMATLGAVPALAAFRSPSSAVPSVTSPTTGEGAGSTGSRFAIDGWNMAANDADDLVLFRLNASWRASWH